MKICRISTVPYQVNVFLKNQIIDTIRNGHEVTVITGYDDELAAFCSSVGAKYIPLKMERRVSPFLDFLSLLALIKIFMNVRFDIVHSLSSKAGFLAAIASFLVRVPIRLHIFAGLPWETMSGVKRKIAMVCDRVIVLLNTKCYSDSNSQAHVLYENGIAKIGAITVLGHGSVTGVDVDRFNFQRYESVKSSLRKLFEIEIDDPVILFVGRVTREKGVSELTHAFCEVKKVIKNLHLIVVGPIDLDVDPLDESIIDLMRQSEDIHLIGEDYEPEKYFAVSDFLVIPSYREGFCNVVIEAASMGKPAIGTRVTGLVDSIIDGDTGILVDVKSVNALIEAIFLLLRDKEMLKIMGVKARIRAQANFSQSYVNNLVIEEYQRVK